MLGSLLGGGQPNRTANMEQAVTGLFGGQQAQGTPGLGGGLQGLLGQFERAGLGSVAQSWVGNGPNQSISPDQMRGVFGDQQIQNMSQQSGIPQEDLLSQLAHHLPHVVDGMTPNGQVPSDEPSSVSV